MILSVLHAGFCAVVHKCVASGADGLAVNAELEDMTLGVNPRCALRNSHAGAVRRTLSDMPLQYIKVALAASWVLGAIIIGVLAQVGSPAGMIVLMALGLLPPLAMLLLWTDPPQTMTESIREGRR